ncbi:MAG: type VI secretion system tip protein TssI/VgrG [Pseudomonadota bacterium]
MNRIFRQDERLGRLTTVMGPNLLVLMRFNGSDQVNGLFEYEVEALSIDPNVNFDQLLGTHATVEIDSRHHGFRAFDGIVTQAVWAGAGENGNRYKLTLRPWLWLAGLRRSQRIFHNMTVVDILQEVLSAYADQADPHLELRLQKDYPDLEYTVQYRESDLAFACRLMERFGITYHFVHTPGSHTLVLTDFASAHDEIPGAVRAYRGVDGHHQADDEHFWEWFPERNLTTGAIRLTDWNFKTPGASMEMSHAGDAAHPNGQHESYDFPGDYLGHSTGPRVAHLRTDQERALDRRHRAIGDCICLRAGMRVELTGEPVPEATGYSHICLSAQHNFVSEAYGTSAERSDEYAYSGAYVFAPVTAPFVPERVTPRPIVHGPQTAVVVGEGEIDCDAYGRILVRFPWDLEDAYSMRCRVSQNWASQGWGGMVIPRIGMEVVVEFIEGDPDMPLVTGCVYNGRNDVPYSLPQHKTRSTFKTNTHEGDGYNELRFEDKKDEEEIFLHAERDHNTVIKHNETHQIGNNRSKVVGVDQKENIGQDKQIDVGRDHVETIGQDEKKFVHRNAERQVDKDSFDYVNNHRVEYTHANHQEEVGAHHYMKVEGDAEVAVGQKLFQRSKIQVLHAKDKFIIGGPGGTIEINSSGVVIRATKIDLKAPVAITSGAPDQINSIESAVNEGLDLAQVCISKLTDD